MIWIKKILRPALPLIPIGALLLTASVMLRPVPAAWAEQPETVCIQCHGSLPDDLGAPVTLWRNSIHAENGISCNSCHGGDPKDAAEAMSPARGFIGAPKEEGAPAFCGRCHPGVLNDYLASAHGRALGNGGPTCVTCHGSHQVLKASLDLINEKSCTTCHSFERAKTIKEAMEQTETRIKQIDAKIVEFHASGVDTDRLGKSLFAVRNRFHTLFHEVNVARVKTESTRIGAELSKLDSDLEAIENTRAKRKIAGAIAVSFMLLMALLLHLLRKTYG